jgi:hypothetical protein
MQKPEVVAVYEERINGQYIADQVNGYRQQARYQDHKRRIQDNFKLYGGDFTSLYPDEWIPRTPKVENKYKNALHDLTRLACEAAPMPVFALTDESTAAYKAARVRETIAATTWEMNNGPDIEARLYMDLIGSGMMALACVSNPRSDYPQFYRLNPVGMYPKVRNGQLISMLYEETMSLEEAASQWPDIHFIKKDRAKNVLVITLFDDMAVSQFVCQPTTAGTKVKETHRVSDTWVHELGCVPVAYRQQDSLDEEFRGLLDQIGGPMMVRNRIVAYMDDYMEDMVHAPYEERGILNPNAKPGPDTIFHHDATYDGNTFMRRVPPAAPAGQVFGVLQYMDDQESKEAIQPPSRVGSVSQSIASGSFVSSTQGGLSSAIKELQRQMGALRKKLTYITFKIDEKHLDMNKPLIRGVKGKNTYTPSKDIKEQYTCRYLFGAAAGVDRQYADQRVLTQLGAGLISKETGRQQIEYLDDAASEQDKIDREQLGNTIFQRFAADPSQPLHIAAQAFIEMGKGASLLEAVEKIAPELVKAAQQQQPTPGGVPGELAVAEAPADGGASDLEAPAPAGPTGPGFAPLEFASQPLQQQIVTTR